MTSQVLGLGLVGHGLGLGLVGHVLDSITDGHQAFAVAGPTVWNSLPDISGIQMLTTDTFKHLVKTFLFSAY